MKRFNVTGNCIPEKHYMVDISGKLAQITEMIDKELYFTINRGRQYGKTTTLGILEDSLQENYVVLHLSFQDVVDEAFETTESLTKMLIKRFSKIDNAWNIPNVTNFDDFSNLITTICTEKKVILIIDEVDKAASFRAFLKFLDLLRQKYLERTKRETFHSVILAGVHDIKNLKQKMITAGTYSLNANEGMILSPWNIAADFDVDMSFNPAEIATMLTDYEKDHQTGKKI